jgi:hypothetical protein
MTDLIGTVKAIRFTSGGFGEQWWTITDNEGNDHSIAMWMDFREPLWAKAGEKVRIKERGEMKIYTGGGGYISIGRTGEIVEKVTT